MKIAVIAPTEIPARRANTVQVMKMAQAFVQNGHDTRLASPHAKTNKDLHKQLSWNKLALHYGLQHQFPIQWFPARMRLRRYDYCLSAVHWARSWGAELIYTRLPQAAALASNLGMGTILEVHDMVQGQAGARLFRRFLSGSGARRLVIITHALEDDILGTYEVPKSNAHTGANFTLVAPDGIDLNRYQNTLSPEDARRELGEQIGLNLPGDKFTAGYTGHLYTGRGTALLLSLAERLPEIIFLLVGGEPEEVTKLQAQVIQSKLTNVLLTGFVPNAELPVFQAACDVLLMPYQRTVAASSGGDISRYLSPMKLFEYMACERAILSSDLPVLKEILNQENALLLPPDNTEAWVEALQQMRTDPALRTQLARQARQDVERYTWKSRANRILDGINP